MPFNNIVLDFCTRYFRLGLAFVLESSEICLVALLIKSGALQLANLIYSSVCFVRDNFALFWCGAVLLYNIDSLVAPFAIGILAMGIAAFLNW